MSEESTRRPGGVIGTAKRGLTRVDRFQRRRRVLAFPFAVIKKFGDDDAGSLAALIAYYGFFSLFPLLLVLTTVLGFALESNESLQEDIRNSTLANFPVIGPEISRATEGGLTGSGVALLVGVVGALWAGLGALQAAEKAMDSVWDVPMKDRPNFLVSRVRALLMLVVFGAFVLATTILGSMGTFSDALGPLASVLGVAGSFVVAVGLFVLLFKILTNRPLRVGDVLPGALVAAAGFVALQLLGGYLVGNRVDDASNTYGTFALVIGLLSWMYLQAQLVLLAAEINVVRHEGLWPRSLTGDDLTDADRRALRRYAEVEERRDDMDVEVDLRDRAPAH